MKKVSNHLIFLLCLFVLISFIVLPVQGEVSPSPPCNPVLTIASRPGLFTVQFQLQGCDCPTLYWDFGDGSTYITPEKMRPNPYLLQHTYPKLGKFSVTVEGSSCQKRAKLEIDLLPPPTGVTASDGGSPNQIAISWSPVPWAQGYSLYRADSEFGNYQMILNTSLHTQYTDQAASPCVTYWYKVVSCYQNYQSNFSSPDRGYVWEGAVKWSLNTGVRYCPAVGTDGTIYLSTNDTLVAITPQGVSKPLCTPQAGVEVQTPAIGLDGTIYITAGKILYAYTPQGKKNWEYPKNTTLGAPVVDSQGRIYVGCQDKNLYSIFPNGDPKWLKQTTEAIVNSPAVGPDGTSEMKERIYIINNDHMLYGLDPDTLDVQGHPVLKMWVIKANLFGPIIGPGGEVYVTDGVQFWAFHPDGSLIWKSPMMENGVHVDQNGAMGADGILYYPGDGGIYKVDPFNNGNGSWLYPRPGGPVVETPRTSPVIGANGTIYFGWNSKIYAINQNGTKLWEFPTGGQVLASPTLGPDHILLAGSVNGPLYAINTDCGELTYAPWPTWQQNMRRTCCRIL